MAHVPHIVGLHLDLIDGDKLLKILVCHGDVVVIAHIPVDEAGELFAEAILLCADGQEGVDQVRKNRVKG